MKCTKCNCNLMIAKSHISFEGDTSAETETKAFNNLTMVCTNTLCDLYGGGKNSDGKCIPLDLNEPKIIVDVLKQAMN